MLEKSSLKELLSDDDTIEQPKIMVTKFATKAVEVKCYSSYDPDYYKKLYGTQMSDE